MPSTEEQKRYKDDAEVLARIGSHLANSNVAPVEVRLPRDLADLALAAWKRDELGPLTHENKSQRVLRRRAGALALIGLSIENGGRVDGDYVIVSLSPDLIGEAFIASDEVQ